MSAAAPDGSRSNATRARTLVIGLDGYETSIADGLMAEGRLPQLRRLRDRSARFRLDHDSAKRTGLAWEHVSLGQSPAAYGRWAAVRFDPASYDVAQGRSSGTPFLADLDARAVIFDAPYFELARAPNCSGLVGWGAHDPGVAAHSVPASLRDEIGARFGAYPAERYIYGFVWPSPERSRAMADAIVRAVEMRTQICRWLFAERLPEWDLAMVVVSEPHSAIEALWHGIDPAHPLHAAPSAGAARDGIIGVYEAADRLVGALCERFADARIVVFSMHGMGTNDSDVATMLLLPELLYRARFARPLFVPRPEWVGAPDGIPPLGPDEPWPRAVNACIPVAAGSGTAGKGTERPLGWMPAARYRRFWPQMDAFALPSFYDGRVRINLAGRERLGRVAAGDYETACARVCALLAACRNPRTGEPVTLAIERPVQDDPLRAGPTQADLVVTWRGAALAFAHPGLGLVGPAPFRRTGGHSGGHGIAYVAGSGAEPGEHGVRSAFDVVPTLIHLLGAAKPSHITGRSLLALG